jgi:hypothetical protein
LVYACCGPSVGFCTEGHPLILGNLNHDPLSSIVKRAQINLLLHFLRLHGPSTLYHIGVGEDLEKKAFENHCEVCLKVLSDQNILKKIWKHLNQPSIRREIALNRFFQFGEPELFLALDDRDEIINESFAY